MIAKVYVIDRPKENAADIRVACQAHQTERGAVWKCGACGRGNVASVEMGLGSVESKCRVCGREVESVQINAPENVSARPILDAAEYYTAPATGSWAESMRMPEQTRHQLARAIYALSQHPDFGPETVAGCIDRFDDARTKAIEYWMGLAMEAEALRTGQIAVMVPDQSAVTAERERCAKIADALADEWSVPGDQAWECATSIAEKIREGQ